MLHNCGDAPWKNPVKGLFHGNFVSPLGVGQLYPLGYSPTPLLLGLPRGGRDLVVLGYAQRGNWSPQRSGGGHTSIATMVTAGAVMLVMVAVVLLGNGLVPPKWRGGACLMAGPCPDPENSPDPIGVPVNPGGGLTPEREG